MESRYERLNLFFERVKTIGFLQRLFRWGALRSLSYDAYEEFKTLTNSIDRISKELDQSNSTRDILQNDVEHLKSSQMRMENEVENLETKLQDGTSRIAELVKENTVLKQGEPQRQKEHENKMSVLTSELERIRTERLKESEEQRQREMHRTELMKQTWARHEENVKHAVKQICQKHTIEYVDVVPFKGNPDNTIKICGEFVIFDAKSPASDDLQNFPSYIRNQAEAVKKYVREENVRKDIYLVIPSNTSDVIRQFSFNLADYSVFVVTIDVLEPLILSLQKLEDYEFADQLTPEERENLCRLIGKFAHTTKRRIQVDNFFAWEFLEVLGKCKTYLPKEILEKVIEFEKSEKLNPPQERRSKQILTKDLESDTEKIQKEAEAKDVMFPPSLHERLKELPLFQDDSTENP